MKRKIFHCQIDFPCKSIHSLQSSKSNAVEPQWLKHLRDHANLLETWVVRATEGNHGTGSGSK